MPLIYRRSFLMAATGMFASSHLFASFDHESSSNDVDVWELSTRHLPCGSCIIGKSRPEFDVHRIEACDPYWRPQSFDELLRTVVEDSRQDLITILYAHGNWMTRENARSRARFIADQLHCRSQSPIRVVSLSWPSQRERRPVQDIKENSDCTDTQAFYFGWLLRELPVVDRLSCLGFSLGGRIVTGALHLDAGGKIHGHGLDTAPPAVDRVYRVSLVAPAVDRSWLQPNGRFHLAMARTEKMVNLFNSKDPVLRRFRFLDSLARPIAAGFAGFIGIPTNAGDPRASEPLASQDRIVQYDCGGSLGSTHDERSYYQKCNHFSIAANNLLWR